MEAKGYFDQNHSVRDLSPALPEDLVWIPDRREQGTIGDEIAQWSHEVETSSGTFRRNRRDIIHLPVEVISPTRPESHESDSETTSEDQLQSGGELPSSPTHDLCRSSCVTYQPNHYHPCAW